MRKTYHLNLSYKRDVEQAHLEKFDTKLSKSFGVHILRTLIAVKPDLQEDSSPF